MSISNKDKDKENREQKFTEADDYDFIREKIKERPVNRKKLLKRTLFTAGMAVIFGLVACLTFLLLEPVFGKLLSSDQDMELAPVELTENPDDGELPEEKVILADEDDENSQGLVGIESETPIDKLPLSDEDVKTTESENAVATPTPVPASVVAAKEIQNTAIKLEDYRLLSRRMYSISKEVEKSLITLTGKDEDSDWTDEDAVRARSTSGVIIGENGYQLLVLADSKKLEAYDDISGKFSSGETVSGFEMFRYDEDTGLAVYALKLSEIPDMAKTSYTIATLAGSYPSSIQGNAVIALGMPCGQGSLYYGFVTAAERKVHGTDSSYQLLDTDIYAGEDASGVLTNVLGQVVGVICDDHHEDGMEHMITAYGISGIRSMIENLSNKVDRPYVGVQPLTVTKDVMKQYGIPEGVCVADVDVDSPAMEAGLGRGDVITAFGDVMIGTEENYVNELEKYPPGTQLKIHFKRQGRDGYADMEVKIETGTRHEDIVKDEEQNN